MNFKTFKKGVVLGVTILAICALSVPAAFAQPVPGGNVNPALIPQFVIPLVIPPVMNKAPGATTNDYDIAVRQFKQQILPGGIWNLFNGRMDAYNPTTVWSYGPAAENRTTVANLVAPSATSQFNYPAYTIENTANQTTTVDWINDLVNPTTNLYRPHLLPVDQTLHWANPGADCIMGPVRTDCRGSSQNPYTGPVPIITHVHGAHVNPESDGYPEAWYLPNASNVVCGTPAEAAADPNDNIYVCEGTIANEYGVAPNTGTGAGQQGVASFSYQNNQPSTTLWYHDHSLGMTRSNVYAGPAGFWLIRETGGGEAGLLAGNLPRPAPAVNESVVTVNFPMNPPPGSGLPAGEREKYREIPIVIQDRSFNANGAELFYPDNRAFFEGLTPAQLQIPFIDDPTLTTPVSTSDISPIWNPEAFFNVMVVNGVSWPTHEVAPSLYRFRLLNGCNSRFLNLALIPPQGTVFKTVYETLPNGRVKIKQVKVTELPFFQIGAEQSLLPKVVMVQTGSATVLPGDGTIPKTLTNAPNKQQALLLGPAERADVIVDFRGLPNGTIIRMINTAPDAPFGGFPDIPADPATTGQVMQFVVNTSLMGQSPTDPSIDPATGAVINPATAATAPESLVLGPVEFVNQFPPVAPAVTRQLALIEEESLSVCVTVGPAGNIVEVAGAAFDPLDPNVFLNSCLALGGMPFAPKAAVLGYVDPVTGLPVVTLWSDAIVTNPGLGDTEAWALNNFTVDAHPIHLHLVKFKVLGRQPFGGGQSIAGKTGVQSWEIGWKDTVIAYPGESTTVAATFDIAGLYVWHCHIVEHEDNEMMVPYCVGDPNANGCAGL